MSGSSGQEKTEKATPRKKQEARKKGQVAKSQDLASAVNLLGVLATFYLLQDYLVRVMHNYMQTFYSTNLNRQLNEENVLELFISNSYVLLQIVGPIMLAAFLISIVANLGQVGFLFVPDAIKPKLEKINPIAGLKRIFSLRSLVELVKSLLKVTIVGYAVYSVVKGNINDLIFTVDMEPYQVFALVSSLVFKIALTAASIFLILGALDFFYQKYEFEKNLRMSKQEIKDEFKQTEGDPFIKGQRRAKQRALTMNRMIQAIPEATVVVTNPTHLSVALKYKTGEFDTPVVVAKGAGAIALKIREVATEHQVPIIENKPVAQVLYKNTEIGDEIPVDLYQAIAEILAVVYKIKGKL